MPGSSPLSFARDGAQCLHAAALHRLPQLRGHLDRLPTGQPGIRLFADELADGILAGDGVITRMASEASDRALKPVRVVYFDKTPQMNWALGWHQDRTICVRRRLDVEGFGPWTLKAGMHHVAPPFAILSRMVTLRLHLDDVPHDNAPLLIAPGSHRHGRIPVGGVDGMVRSCGIAVCLAKAGDVWVYATPILHASNRATSPGRRRVLQIDFSGDDLPGGLEWAHP